MKTRRMLLLLTLAALVAACTADDTTTTSEPRTTVPETSTTTSAPVSSSTTTTSTTTTREMTTTTAPTALPGGEFTRCESPEGYTIEYPAEWMTNPGDTAPTCGQFHPEDFEVTATDERLAAVTVYIDPVPFSEVTAPDPERNADRAVTAIDGLQAVRLEFEASGTGLWPEGTPITMYAIDVTPADGEPATMFVDTMGLSTFDYETNQIVLDRMARTIDVDIAGVEDDPSVVAAYRGGGGGFSVVAEAGDEVCLRIPPNGEPICTAPPAEDQLHTIQLTDLDPVLAGVTGEDVFAVNGIPRDGNTSTVLPAPIHDSRLGAFSFVQPLSDFESFVLLDVTGTELRTITPGG
jgi:hypothetical protein